MGAIRKIPRVPCPWTSPACDFIRYSFGFSIPAALDCMIDGAGLVWYFKTQNLYLLGGFMSVRVRFAPSPTGYLHVGGVRTAIFNSLFARRHKGTFILRIEDTDVERSTKEALDQILDSMRWVGLNWDEGPYYQSQRMGLYREHLDRLLKEGKAYRCYCTPEELEKKRKQAEADKVQNKYDRTCRKRDPNEDPAGRPFTIRFRMPEHYPDSFDDLILGKLPIEETKLDDWILARKDGTPVYNFCVVVDDADMKITHVLRGNDHVANTPRQVLLYLAFGYEPPRFAHIPLIHGPDGSKLSKRREEEYRKLGMSVSVQEYRKMGYLPHALFNYMTRVGWSCGDQEIFSREELEEKFDLKDVVKSSGMMNPEKLKWLNAHYIKETGNAALGELALPFLAERGFQASAGKHLEQICDSLKERSKTLADLAERATFYFKAPEQYDAKAVKKWWGPEAAAILKEVKGLLQTASIEDEKSLEDTLRMLSEKRSAGDLGKVAQPLRLALTGNSFSPSLFTVMSILGKKECEQRIDRAVHEIERTKTI
jgi:glutamyl-tRNA synthetase